MTAEWAYQEERINGDVFHAIYVGDEYVATFNDKDECERVIALWNAAL